MTAREAYDLGGYAASPQDLADASPPAPSDAPSFQLSGDARLQFWRETYLAALPALLASLEPGNVGTLTVLERARLACDAADAALAQHLARNAQGEVDQLAAALIGDLPNRVAVATRGDRDVPK